MKTSEKRALRIVEEALYHSRVMNGRPRPADEESFYRWLKTSPEHVETLLIQDALSARFATWAAAQLSERQSFPLPANTAPSTAATPSRRRVWALAACVGAVMLAGLPFIMNAWQGAQWTTRETNESATRIPLTDDSTIQLYQHSEVRFRDFLGRPEAELLRGGARFKVERNDLRRFRVRSGHTTITALGTEFNVLRLNGRTGVYVINGVVRVQSDRALADLTPGAAVSFSENGQMEVLQPEATMTNGFLTASVRIIAAELNRRQRLPRIVVEGPVAAGRRFTSSFSLDQPEHWVQALERDPSLEIVRRGNVVIVRERRSER